MAQLGYYFLRIRFFPDRNRAWCCKDAGGIGEYRTFKSLLDLAIVLNVEVGKGNYKRCREDNEGYGREPQYRIAPDAGIALGARDFEFNGHVELAELCLASSQICNY